VEKGILKKKTDKGYGFISREGHDKDLFFHANEVQGGSFDSLREGEEVTFEMAENEKGLFATKVAKA